MAKFKSPERFLRPDPKYGSKLASKFVNNLMRDGKKTTAEKIFYGALEDVKQKLPEDDPFEVFKKAIDNVKPRVEVRSKRVGGATYQVPMEVNRRRQQALAMRWILDAVRGRKGRPMHEKLADELISAYKGEGAAVSKRSQVHKMADANKAFAHFAW